MTIRALLSRSLFATLAMLVAVTSNANENTSPAALKHLEQVQCTGKQAINTEGYVPINGIEQWVTIKGAHCDNPVILFIHGGPGNAMSPYSESVYGTWAKHFTLVQWDQRGAGKTFSRNKETANTELTLAQMTTDGIEVSNFLRRHLGKRKVILTGSSWGSVLAIHMAKRAPELFHAYVGVAQVVGMHENETATYEALLKMTRQADDQKSLAQLEAMGAPAWVNPRNFGMMRRITRAYEAKTTTPAPKAWWKPAPGYDTPQLLADAEEADDYSYIQFIGMTGQGMFSKIDLAKLGTDFKLPVFIIQGTEDLVTRPDVSRRYFDSISAPQKEWVAVASAGHDPNAPFIDAQYKVMMERVRPIAK